MNSCCRGTTASTTTASKHWVLVPGDQNPPGCQQAFRHGAWLSLFFCHPDRVGTVTQTWEGSQDLSPSTILCFNRDATLRRILVFALLKSPFQASMRTRNLKVTVHFHIPTRLLARKQLIVLLWHYCSMTASSHLTSTPPLHAQWMTPSLCREDQPVTAPAPSSAVQPHALHLI